MIDPLWYFLVLSLVLDLLFAAVRSAMLNSRPAQLVAVRAERPGAIERAMALLDRPRLRISLRLAVVFSHLSFGVLVWMAAAQGQPPLISMGGAFVILFLAGGLLLMLESAVEGSILANPEGWALRLAPVAFLLDFLFTPLSALLMAFMRYGNLKPSPAVVTDDELRNWVEEEQPNGSLEKGERKMIYSIFRFGETLAREIMVPRIDVAALDIDTPLGEAIQALSQSGHSRMPVYEETIDNIVGLLYAKDMLPLRRNEEEPLRSMQDLLRPAHFVPEAKKVDALLAEMQASRIHLAIVVDEYGGVAGLVTLEDIMEEIIGEVQDEYDQAEEMLYQQVAPEEYVFQGRIDLGDFNEIMGSRLSKETADTLAGFIYGEIGRVPAGGESVDVDGMHLTVEQVAGRRIRKVRACRSQPANELEGGSNDVDK